MTGAWPAGVMPPPPGPPAAPAAPLILTAALPAALAAAIARARAMLDPGRAARTPPHLTLFRHLPGPMLPALLADIRALVADGPAPGFTLEPPRAQGGQLVARARSPRLDDIRAELADRWHGLLTPGDRAPPRLHVTLGRAGGSGAGGGVPTPALPPGPHRVAALLMWAHRGDAARDEPVWTALVAVPFRR